MDLWKSGVYAVDRSRNNPDRSLLANISRPFPLNNYPRTVDGSGGSWAEGATTVPMRDRVWPLTISSSKDFVDNSINSSWDRKPLVAPNDYLWKQVANSGTYSFVDNIQAEGMFYSDINSYSVKTVEDNYITQSIDLSRNGDGNFEISSITNFDTKVGDVQTETKETRRGTKTTSYRTLSVTETTYTFNNGEVSESTRTYERRQRVRDN